jgi:hypothetical protein
MWLRFCGGNSLELMREFGCLQANHLSLQGTGTLAMDMTAANLIEKECISHFFEFILVIDSKIF